MSEPSAPTAKAFCCYSSRDRELVMPLVNLLRAEIEFFLDVLTLRAGQRWDREIATCIQNSRRFYLFWSANAQASPEVEREWQLALRIAEERQIPDFIVPVLLDKTPLPEEIRSRFHATAINPSLFEEKPDDRRELFREIDEQTNSLKEKLVALDVKSHLFDQAITFLDQAAREIAAFIRKYPNYYGAVQPSYSLWLEKKDKLLFLKDNQDEEMARLFALRQKEIYEAVNYAVRESVVETGRGAYSEGKYLPFSLERIGYSPAIVTALLIKGTSSLEHQDSVDLLLSQDNREIEDFFTAAKKQDILNELYEIFWQFWPHIHFYHPGKRKPLAKLFGGFDLPRWTDRLRNYIQVINPEIGYQDAQDILNSVSENEKEILATCMLSHKSLECRKLGVKNSPPKHWWDLIVHPQAQLRIIKELVSNVCGLQDIHYYTYIKSVFLLLRPRLTEATEPDDLAQTYEIMKSFYSSRPFLEDTFFNALVDLHKILKEKSQKNPLLRELEKDCEKEFLAFCNKNRLKDIDVTQMGHIPLPIQRKLAHDGHFIFYFICNVMDLIALETVPHAMKRPDVVKFFRLKIINGRALEKLAENKKLMQEYQNRATFCRNPKAPPAQLRMYMSGLYEFDLKQIENDRTVNQFAREQAIKIRSRKTL